MITFAGLRTTMDVTGDIENKGELKGHGTYSTSILNNYGLISPGDETNRIGSMTIIGDLNTNNYLGTSGYLFELGGYEQGSQYDFLNILGSAELAGTLHIDFIDDFIPTSGSLFHLFHASDGFNNTSFTSLLLPDFEDGRYLELFYGDTDIYLNVKGEQASIPAVPEPATIFLFGGGLVSLIGSRIRRKKKLNDHREPHLH